ELRDGLVDPQDERTARVDDAVSLGLGALAQAFGGAVSRDHHIFGLDSVGLELVYDLNAVLPQALDGLRVVNKLSNDRQFPAIGWGQGEVNRVLHAKASSQSSGHGNSHAVTLRQ